MPSVSWMGDVVRVSSEVPKMSRINLVPIIKPRTRPSLVTVRNQSRKRTSPSVRKTLSPTVRRRITMRGRKPLITKRQGSSERWITAATANATKA